MQKPAAHAHRTQPPFENHVSGRTSTHDSDLVTPADWDDTQLLAIDETPTKTCTVSATEVCEGVQNATEFTSRLARPRKITAPINVDQLATNDCKPKQSLQTLNTSRGASGSSFTQLPGLIDSSHVKLDVPPVSNYSSDRDSTHLVERTYSYTDAISSENNRISPQKQRRLSRSKIPVLSGKVRVATPKLGSTYSTQTPLSLKECQKYDSSLTES